MGSIEVICGGMFSGKTEEMIRRMRRATIGGKKVFLGKASKDTRYDNEQVVTHNMDRMDSVPIASVDELYQVVGDADVIGIGYGLRWYSFWSDAPASCTCQSRIQVEGRLYSMWSGCLILVSPQ